MKPKHLITKAVKCTMASIKKPYYLAKYPTSLPASPAWLVGTEIKYGGFHDNVHRNKISPLDPRPQKDITRGGMAGGDRMLYHDYVKKYSEYLLPLVGKNITLAEFGILKGTGLAIWCDLFPSSRILGFDIDLGHTQNNMENLRNLGAFKKNEPELYEYDQFLDNTEYLRGIIKKDKIKVCIDDGLHSRETILNTIKSTLPYLANKFVYIIEDNSTIHKEIRKLYPSFNVDNKGELTVIFS